MRVLFLITARGGSKGVPGKNLRQIGGIPLVGFKAISAVRSKYCHRLIVSTDNTDIQKAARSYGAEVPFTRPAHLATDKASSVDVVLHAMSYVESESSERYDALMLLEPSSPFATHIDYDKAVETMARNDTSAVVGIRAVEVHSSKVGPLDDRSRIRRPIDRMAPYAYRRQDDRQEYTLNGALYLLRWEFFKESHRIMGDPDNTYGHVMDRAHSIEIDEEMDLAWAEFLVDKGYVDMTPWLEWAPVRQIG